MLNFLKKHLDKEDSDLKKNNHAIKNQESQKKTQRYHPQEKYKKTRLESNFQYGKRD